MNIIQCKVCFMKYINNLVKTDKFVGRIQNKLANYIPKSVRRFEIRKPNGKTTLCGRC